MLVVSVLVTSCLAALDEMSLRACLKYMPRISCSLPRRQALQFLTVHIEFSLLGWAGG